MREKSSKLLLSSAVRIMIAALLVRPAFGVETSSTDPVAGIIGNSGLAAIVLFTLNAWNSSNRKSAEDMKEVNDRLLTLVEKLSNKAE